VGKRCVAVVTRDGARLGVTVLDRQDGEMRFDMPGGLCAGAARFVLVDDMLIVNSSRGELIGLNLETGKVVYRHIFASCSSRAVDRPRSLAPVLRGGALFVPQSEIYVVRPTDGALLGHLPAELIPDALRVDERCGVYVAEASGYVIAYRALPALTLV
jgi:hypothetical protein